MAAALRVLAFIKIGTHAIKRGARTIFAALFLFVLMAHWGSHVVICADGPHGEERSVSTRESGHHDPCQSLILCSDNKQRDQQVPKLGHDASQHNALFDPLAGLDIDLAGNGEPRIPFGSARAIFRPPHPPFHPPKQI